MIPDTPNINVNSCVKNNSIFIIQELLLSPSNRMNLARVHKIFHCHQYDSTTEARRSIFIIEVISKICRPKVQNRYAPPDYAIDIDDGVFDFDFYNKTIFRPKQVWKNIQRDDLIPFRKELHQKEIHKQLQVQTDLDSQTRSRVKNAIRNYWDCFCKKGD